MSKKSEGKLKKVEIALDPAIKLDDDGFAELMARIEEDVYGGLDEGEECEAVSVTLEVRTSDVDTSEDSQNAE